MRNFYVGGSVIVLMGAGLLTYYVQTQYVKLEAALIETKKVEVAAEIQRLAEQTSLTEYFMVTDVKERDAKFEKFWSTLQSPDVVRMKAWSTDSVILWSDIKEGVGQQFLDSHELEEALEGEVEFELIDREHLKSAENMTERRFEELSEVYIPIRNQEGAVVGVIEIYRSTVDLRAELKQAILTVALKAGVGALVACALILIPMHRFFRRTAA